MFKQKIKYIIQSSIQIALKPFYIFPIRKNRILFLSLEGGSKNEYSCNPKYFCEYLLKHAPGKYECVWLMMHPENYKHLAKKGIIVSRHFTLKGIYYALTSRVVISNGGYFAWFPFRKKQLCINTWHGGGAYKKLENDMHDANAITLKRMRYAADHMDAFISSNRIFSEEVVKKGFLFNKDILEIGMPRNDILLSDEDSPKVARRVRKKYHIPENAGILLYAPTFRSGEGGSYPPVDAALLLSHLEKKTGQTWYLFDHAHTKSDGTAMLKNRTEHCIDVSDYPDTQHLLCCADAMLSDYSSIIWDFILTEKPVYLYTPDLEAYRKGRGFYVDIPDWGLPLCSSMKELLDAVDQTSAADHAGFSRYHLNLLASCEKGDSCRQLLDYIERSI